MGRFSGNGEECSLSVLNSTTKDPICADAGLEKLTFTIPFELTKKQFIGDVGPTYREFGDGYEITFTIEHTQADQVVTLINALSARAQGSSSDEFAAGCTFKSADGGSFRLSFYDLHFEGIPLDLSGRTEFLTTELKAKGKTFKAAII